MLAPVMHNHLNWVFDLETLGTSTDAIITEVSAVAFEIDTGRIVFEKTWFLDIDGQHNDGRSISSSTLEFWLTQPKESRLKLLSSCRNRDGSQRAMSVLGFLGDLKHHMEQQSLGWSLYRKGVEGGGDYSEEPRVWGNGISFDIGKLNHLYESNFSEHVKPWPFWGECDARTLVAIAPHFKKEMKFEGIKHFGLDDCKHEVKYLTKIYQAILEAANVHAKTVQPCKR